MSTALQPAQSEAPATTFADPVIELHVTAPTLRVPVPLVEQLAERGIAWLEEWKRSAPGVQLAAYGAFKVAVNLGLALAPGLLGAAVDAGLLPPLPPRPRHSEPVVFLARYLASALPQAAARAPWTLHADPQTGIVTDLDWGGYSMTHPPSEPPVIVEEGVP